jgi:acyl dehydratase
MPALCSGIRQKHGGLTGLDTHDDLHWFSVTPKNRTDEPRRDAMPYVPVAQLKDYVGKELGRSEWLTIDQARINLFAEATGDHQFIHVDPVKAAQTPFGSTIAHGFLSLSLMPKLMEDILIMPEGLKMAVNYGLDSVRFIQPVKVQGAPERDPHRRHREKTWPMAVQGHGHPGNRRPGKAGLYCGVVVTLLRVVPSLW